MFYFLATVFEQIFGKDSGFPVIYLTLSLGIRLCRSDSEMNVARCDHVTTCVAAPFRIGNHVLPTDAPHQMDNTSPSPPTNIVIKPEPQGTGVLSLGFSML